MSVAALALPTLRSRGRRLLALLAFAALFLGAAALGRALAGEGGHVEMDLLFQTGGYPAVSALLLLGWLIGRFPIIASLVLLAGVFSDERAHGHARLYHARPVQPVAVYATRVLVLMGAAFLLGAVLLPLFDLLMLGTWAGPATFVLVAAQVLVYGSLVAFLSVWIRGDAWVALLLAVAALVWDAMLRAGALAQVPPGARGFLAFVLPPQPALLALEGAFGAMEPIPWEAFGFVASYAAILLLLAGVSVASREV